MSGDPKYSNSYSDKVLIWISVSVFDFNMDVKQTYSNSFFLYPI
jgi:hypothetical protein